MFLSPISIRTLKPNLRKFMIWFDPLFNQNVKTKFEKTYLKLPKQHYPKHLKLNNI